MSFNLTGKLYHLYHSLKTAGAQNISIMKYSFLVKTEYNMLVPLLKFSVLY